MSAKLAALTHFVGMLKHPTAATEKASPEEDQCCKLVYTCLILGWQALLSYSEPSITCCRHYKKVFS